MIYDLKFLNGICNKNPNTQLELDKKTGILWTNCYHMTIYLYKRYTRGFKILYFLDNFFWRIKISIDIVCIFYFIFLIMQC